MAKRKSSAYDRIVWLQNNKGLDIDSRLGWRFVSWIGKGWDVPQRASSILQIAAADRDRQEFVDRFRELAPTPMDRTIPWLWREWLRSEPKGEHEWMMHGHVMDRGLDSFSFFRDWYIDQRPDLVPMTWSQALNNALDWHEDLEEREDAAKWRRMWKEEKAEALLSFRPLGGADGGVWTVFCSRTKEVRPLQMVGGILRHCYVGAGLARHYTYGKELLVLFDEDQEPVLTLSAKWTVSDRELLVEEVRGAMNAFPEDPRWHGAIAQIVWGDKHKGSMFSSIPKRWGGRPFRARFEHTGIPSQAAPTPSEFWGEQAWGLDKIWLPRAATKRVIEEIKRCRS